MWDDAKMEVLVDRVVETMRGAFRPRDGVPFFRFLYPPESEREALQRFKVFCGRLQAMGFSADWTSLAEIMEDALSRLFGATGEGLLERVRAWETEVGFRAAAERLVENLPDEMASLVVERFGERPRDHCLVLPRAGVLYPFARVSSLLSRLEGRVRCVVVVPYPGDQAGEMLGERSFDTASGYYRGEVL